MTRALELYCGIGGFTSAFEQYFKGEVVAAIDISPHVVQAYNRNWKPVAVQKDLLSLDAEDLDAFDADLWWMSPPCAPYTRRGNQEDLSDHRAQSFLHLLDLLKQVRPAMVALENVEGFATSRARDVLIEHLDGYALTETVLCPTQLGVPNLRPRYYLAARRDGDVDTIDATDEPLRDWRDYVRSDVDVDALRVPPEIIDRYGDGFRVVDDGEDYTTCFTGSYGKSWNFTGSYLRADDGTLRRFSPDEVLAFLGFPPTFTFPEEFSRKQRWKYAGNSLSLPAVRQVLDALGLERR